MNVYRSCRTYKSFNSFFIFAIFLGIIYYLSRTNDKTTNVISERTINNYWMVLVHKFELILDCTEIEHAARLNSQWNIVVVDLKGLECSPSNIYFIESKSFPILKGYYNLRVRQKMAGYLFAMQYGATHIYEGKMKHNHEVDLFSHFDFTEENKKYLVPQERGLLNPSIHFGQNYIKSRTFFAENITEPGHEYKLLHKPKAVIQSSMTAKIVRKGRIWYKIDFDKTAPPFVLPLNGMTPTTFDNSLISHEAFWILFLPPSYESSGAEVIRTLWAQKILSIGNFSVSFKTSNGYIKYIETFNTPVSLMVKERKLHSRLIKFFKAWTCKMTWINCIKKMNIDLYENNFWTKKDLKFFKIWISIIEYYGFGIPEKSKDNFNSQELAILSKRFMFYPVEKKETFYSADDSITDMTLKENFQSVCSDIPIEWFSKHLLKRTKFAKTALIIHSVHGERLFSKEMLKLLYQHQFPVIIFCGDEEDYDQFYFQNINITFIPSPSSQKNTHSLDCSTIAMEMGYNVEGFLQIRSDVVLHPWTFTKWNRANIWYTVTKRRNDTTEFKYGALINNDFQNEHFENLQHPSVLQALDDMQNYPPDSHEYICHVKSKTKLEELTDHVTGDYLYIPKRLAKAFARVQTQFIRHGVSFERAVPIVLKCIEPIEHHEMIPSRIISSDICRNEETYQNHINYSYVHKFKFDRIFNKDMCSDIFCDHIMKETYDRL